MSSTEVIKKRYDRTSLIYDCMDWIISDELRKKVVGFAHGKVLEVGVGTGKNLRFYSPDCQITGIDFSPGMLKKAMERSTGFDNISLHEMDVENLLFPDDTFDTVLGTCVFCSVPDPIKGFSELRRVCKPDGRLVFLEHIRSSKRLMGLMMDLFNPLFVRVVGANINRQTLANMEKSGLELEKVETVGMEVMKLIVAKPIK